MALGCLAISLASRFIHEQRDAYLDEAITSLQEVIDLTPRKNDPNQLILASSSRRCSPAAFWPPG